MTKSEQSLKPINCKENRLEDWTMSAILRLSQRQTHTANVIHTWRALMLSENTIRTVLKIRRQIPAEKREIVKLCNPNLLADLLSYYNDDCPKKVKILIRNLFENNNNGFDRSASAMANIATQYKRQHAEVANLPNLVAQRPSRSTRTYRGVVAA